MRILVVEDEKALSDALCEILKRDKYSVDAAYDGMNGFDMGQSGIYDAIILDIMLPKMNGIDVLLKLRAQGVKTPVLLLTARDGVKDKVKGLDSGADDYLTKPFSKEELSARVRALCRRKGEDKTSSLTFCGTTLDTLTYTLSAENGSLKLGLKEFQIAHMLFAAPQNIATKELILEKVWGFDSDAEYNNVEVYISFLRKKLGFIGSKVKIKAVRGIGYTLEGQND